ncbi:MAG: hypothetical protein EBR82_51735 [Caulobacteraceae bacterium]|nr:hypothetical protein [Caulobacteraceae bacterium]
MALKINDNGTDREMTADEEAAYLAFSAQIQDKQQKLIEAEQKKLADKQAVLDKLGLTADEAKALLG